MGGLVEGFGELEGSVEDPVVSVWPCDGVGVAVWLYRLGGMAGLEGELPAFVGSVISCSSGLAIIFARCCALSNIATAML
jgi:hypothetical protein